MALCGGCGHTQLRNPAAKNLFTNLGERWDQNAASKAKKLQEEPTENLAWSPMGHSVPAKLEEQKQSVVAGGGACFSLLNHPAMASCNKLREQTPFWTYATAVPAHFHTHQSSGDSWAWWGEQTEGWVLLPMQALCSGAKKHWGCVGGLRVWLGF